MLKASRQRRLSLAQYNYVINSTHNMQIIKEMHETLDTEERLIEKAEAEINAQLRNINVRRGNLSLKRIELSKLQRAALEQECRDNAPPGGWITSPDSNLARMPGGHQTDSFTDKRKY